MEIPGKYSRWNALGKVNQIRTLLSRAERTKVDGTFNPFNIVLRQGRKTRGQFGGSSFYRVCIQSGARRRGAIQQHRARWLEELVFQHYFNSNADSAQEMTL